MAVPTDPLLATQWHLNQTVAGLLDLNVLLAWQLGYTGAGTFSLVIDDGFDYTHADLAPNYDTFLDFDFDANNNGDGANDFDPFGQAGDAHGTAVAGIIGADDNGTGAVGVAFDTSIIGYRIHGFINDGWLQDIRDAIGAAALNAQADVTNISQGIANDATSEFGVGYNAARFDEIETSINTAVTQGRAGLGMTIVKSAGNSRIDNYDVNADDWTNDTRQVVVGAVDQDGFVSSYSSYGAALLVSGFGTPGEVVTTDRVGGAGYDADDFDETFNGTSAAAPMVAGIVALMYDANAGLGWRDVQTILAYTARHVGSDIGAGIAGAERYAWQWNAASNWNGGALHFSNDYGYGLVDGSAAVLLAETWLDSSAAQTSSNEFSNFVDMLNVATVIPDGNLTGLTFTGNAAFDDVVERVTVQMTFSTTFTGDMEIYLTSPDGTVSELIRDVGGSNDFNGTWTFESQAFRGEHAAGQWSVRIVDDAGGDVLTVSDIVVRTFGVASTSDRYIFTNEYATFGGVAGHNTITDTNGGTDQLNAAAVTGNSIINLTAGSVSTIAGQSLTIAIGTNIENAYGGIGNDTITGNTLANRLLGGRGTDLLNGGSGADTMLGGAGNDTYVVDDANDVVDESVTGSDGVDTVYAGVTFSLVNSATVLGSLERLVLTGAASIHATGNGLSNLLIGNGGNNVLNGGTGIDTMRGLGGNDSYVLDTASDVVDESVAGSGGFDTVYTAFSFSLASSPTLLGNIENLTLTGAASIHATGNGLSNLLIGNGGNNVLNGGTGADQMRGLGGNDSYVLDTASDVVDESVAGSGGVDTVYTAFSFSLASSPTLLGNIESLTLTGAAAVNATGNGLSNLLIGNGGTNVLNGGTGADQMRGLGGDDYYVVDNTSDVVDESVAGSGGVDTVYASIGFNLADAATVKGNVERLVLQGSSNLHGFGNSLSNAIFGNGGNNLLNGSNGNDQLTGGAGNDTFIFNTALNAATNVDAIFDFSVPADTIMLENSIFSTLAAGGLAASAFHIGAAAADALDRIIYNNATGALIYDSNGSAAGGATQFASLSAGLAMTNADFLVI